MAASPEVPFPAAMSARPDPERSPEPITIGQWLALATLVLAGAWLRFDGLASASLSHFDEGVYLISAYNAHFEGPWAFRLKLPFQAPPLYPWSVALAFAATGDVSPTTGLLTSAFAGTATTPLLFVFARRLGGNRFGLAAASLLALSDLHVAYSRAALTDASLTFWFLLAQLAIDRLVTGLLGRAKPSLPATAAWTLLAGLLVAACWNTKYNGWMPVAIAVTALALSAARRRLVGRPAPEHTRTLAAFAGLAVAGLIAAATFVPWYHYVERSFPGGYAAVVANHRSYLGGPADWPVRALRLAASLPAFRHTGWAVAIALGTAVWVAFVRSALHSSSGAVSRASRIALSAALLAAAFVEGTDLAFFLLALAGIAPALLRGGWRVICLAVWVAAFVLLVPVYYPYVRLLLPALPAAICLGLLTLCRALNMPTVSTPADPIPPPRHLRPLGAALAAAALLASAANPFGLVPSAGLWNAWTTHRSYRELGDAVDRLTPENAVILLKTSPAAWPYARRLQVLLESESPTAIAADLPPGQPVYLALDYQSLKHERRERTLDSDLACLTPEAVIPNDLNLISLLDHLTPEQVAARLRPEQREIKTARTADRRSLPVPAKLDSRSADVIVLYRMDRSCIGGH